MINEFNAENLGIESFELARQYNPNLIYMEIDHKFVLIKNLPKELVDYCNTYKGDLNIIENKSFILSFFFSQMYQIFLIYFLGRWKVYEDKGWKSLCMNFKKRWLLFLQDLVQFGNKFSRFLKDSKKVLFTDTHSIESFENLIIHSIKNEIYPILIKKIQFSRI